MRNIIAAALFCLVTFFLVPILPAQSTPMASAMPSMSDPAISPDGHEIAFVSGGDIWSVPAVGGQAHLLITNPATESRPLFSPDGKRLAFMSTRTGQGNIYLLTLETGDLRRLTYSDATDHLDSWSADGEWIYFTSSVNDIAGQGDIFRVKAAGGTPLEVSAERYMNEFESAPSPDGKQIAFMAKGISSAQWWRDGHSHIDDTEIWLKPVEGQAGYRKILAADSKHAWPMWSPDGRTIYFMADGSGSENIWQMPLEGTPRELTHFKSGRVLWPSIGNGGKTVVFERDMSIWRMDTGSGRAEKVPIELRGSSETLGISRNTETSFRGLALSPDGKKVAVLAHGQLFAALAAQGGEGERVPSDAVSISDAKWSPDSNSLLYVAERADGARQLESYSFATGKVSKLTNGPGVVEEPAWSPDGKSVAYILDTHQLHELTLANPAASPPSAVPDRVLAHGDFDGAVAWSPDSHWVAFVVTDKRSFNNIHVVPAAGGEALPISFLANGETASRMAWSPDGRYILFDTAQRSEEVQLARIDLLPHVPRYREDEFRELFRQNRQPGSPDRPTPPQLNPANPESPGKDQEPVSPPMNPAPETPATQTPATQTPAPAHSPLDTSASDMLAKRPGHAGVAAVKPVEPVKIVFEGIRERLTLLPLGLSANFPVISPDGKTLVFSAQTANQQELYTYSLDELSREPAVARQLTSTPGRKSDYAFTPDSKELFFLENGSVRVMPIETRMARPVNLSARVEVDFDQEKRVVFEEAWGTLNRRFYDANFNGHDWRKLHDEWAPYINGVRTEDELRQDINLMIGELNSSHSGINRPQGINGREESGVTRVGNLGLRFDRGRYERGDGLIVREVIALGPAAIEGTIKPGDTLISIDGQPIETHDLDDLMQDKVGHRTVLGVETGGKARDAVVRPIASTAASGLLYREWVEQRRALVDRLSGGKVGYVHMQAMGDDNLRQLYLDLDASNESKQAVIVDVRNNNGGYINGYALDVFTRRNYLEMTPRGEATHPSRQALGQRALGLPTALVTNESTLSDGEDFTEGYRALGLGKVVGEPTAGWIIFTGAQQLIDGSSVRVPFVRIQDTHGQPMEMHPRPVDVQVDRQLGETEAGTDQQLARAVEVLLQEK
jgi:tricorn protease